MTVATQDSTCRVCKYKKKYNKKKYNKYNKKKYNKKKYNKKKYNKYNKKYKSNPCTFVTLLYPSVYICNT